MKIFIPFTVFIVVSINALLAQEIASSPKTEFVISLSQNAIELTPGETKDITIMLHRSRSYSKLSSAMSLSSSLPDGVGIIFEPSSGVIESTKASISANETAKPGNYTIIVNCTINHRNKGSMLKLVIKNSGDLSTGL